MSGAPVGAEVGLYFDTPRTVAEADIIINAYTSDRPEARAYEVTSVRRQQRGKHAGRWHLRAIVVSTTREQLQPLLAGLAPEQTVHRMYWYRRT